MAAAVLAGYTVAYRRVKAAGQDPEHLTNILIIGLISAIIGARLYYVLFNLGDYLANPSEVVAVWHGGLAIHGALTGGILATVLYTRKHRLDFWYWADLIIPSMILGQAIGRWGNYMNQEAFGTPTNLPWAIFIRADKRPLEYLNFSHFHPTFLYESIWNLIGFGVLIYLAAVQKKDPRKWPAGSLLLAYGIYYSIGRGLIESLRTDSLMFGPIRAAQLASVALILVCGVWLRRKRSGHAA